MARDTRKHLPDPESDEGEDVDVPSSKKLKTASSSRRSGRAGKGVGGAVDQLKKVGDAVLTDRSKKSKSDRFAASGETLNPMAPPDGNRVSDGLHRFSTPFSMTTVDPKPPTSESTITWCCSQCGQARRTVRVQAGQLIRFTSFSLLMDA